MSDKKKPTRKTPGPDYKVGYGKPPRHTRFQPGRSGNPRGRPKGTKNLKTDLLEELGEKVLIREGEDSRWVSKQRAIIKTLILRVLKGDLRAVPPLLALIVRFADPTADAPEVDELLSEADHEIIKDFMRREQERSSVRADASGEGEPDPEGES